MKVLFLVIISISSTLIAMNDRIFSLNAAQVFHQNLLRNRFIYCEMTYSNFNQIFAKEIDWTNGNLEGSKFFDCDFSNAVFFEARLPRTYFNRSIFSEVSFYGADLTRAKFDDINLQRTSFANAQMQFSVFIDCDLREADFSGADLTGATYSIYLPDQKKTTAGAVTGAWLREQGAHWQNNNPPKGIEPEDIRDEKPNDAHSFAHIIHDYAPSVPVAKNPTQPIQIIQWHVLDYGDANNTKTAFVPEDDGTGLTPVPHHNRLKQNKPEVQYMQSFVLKSRK